MDLIYQAIHLGQTVLQPQIILLVSLFFYSIFGGWRDSLLVVAAATWQARSWLTSRVSDILHDTATACRETTTWKCLGLAAVALLLVAAAVWLWTRTADEANASDTTGSPSPLAGPGPVLLFPSIVSHHRMFPKKHSFIYSNLVVGVPVSWEGNVGGMVSAGRQIPRKQKTAWYHIHPDYYLGRELGHPSLRQKLDGFLQSEGIDPSLYPHAYLVTVARFLGYQNNPVSFWYLYDAEMKIAAMLAEVNNTFGERRIYFLTPDPQPEIAAEEGGGLPQGTATTTFRRKFAKDMHVSPFNARGGFYAITATDPFAADTGKIRTKKAIGPLHVTVVLQTPEGHGQIVARMYSAAPAVDPRCMTAWQKLRFVASWWWVGLMAMPRTFKEAGVLFFRHRLAVWVRPEPLAKSIPRLAEPTERRLEAIFRLYLRRLVEQQVGSLGEKGKTTTTKPLVVRYIPNGIPGATPEIMGPVGFSPSLSSPASLVKKDGMAGNAGMAGEDVDVEFRVLTPAFYSRFVRYAHDVEALFCELRESCTIDVTRPELLAKLVLSTREPRGPQAVASLVDWAAFKAIQKLRRLPEPILRPLLWTNNGRNTAAIPTTPSTPTTPAAEPPASSSAYTSSGDIRGFRPSGMDGFALVLKSEGSSALSHSYRDTVLSMFLAERVAGGKLGLFQLQWLAVRVLVAWLVASGMLSAVKQMSEWA